MLKSDRGNLRTVHLVVRWIMFVLVLVFQLSPAMVQANPTGGEVAAGQVQINNAGNLTTINQASQKAVIKWQDFSIASGEVTKFIQPNANATVLNKVIGNNVSQIYGTLQANGKVFLVNQSGVFVGSGGVIDTAGFVASTLDLDTETFMKGGDMKFTGNSQASIVNLGNINGTDGVFLISQKIENSGTITAAKGEAGLAAGSEVLLKQSGDERTSVLVGSASSGTGISNKGEIAAAVATMKATGSMYSVAVNNEGIVRAQGVNMSGGKVRLTGLGGTVINSGALSAKTSNEKGGTVIVEGKNVGLINDAVVDVSGKKGGGTALIGGGYQGANSDVINAERTYVSAGTQIKADAEESGNGGKVVLWSENETNFYGSVSAQAKGNSGDGGSVEVSSKGFLNFSGTVNTLSAHGHDGTLLLDPTDIYLATDQASATTAGMVGTNTSVNDGASPFDTTAAVGDSFLATSAVVTALGTGNVIISTTNASGTGDGDIFVVNGFTYAGATGRTLTLNAERDIVFSGGAVINSTTGILNVALNADTNTTGGGAVVMNALSGITSNGGNITIGGTGRAGSLVGVSLTGATLTAGGGNISITGTGAGTGNAAHGVAILGDSVLSTTGTGTLAVTGTATTTGNSTEGLRIVESDLSVVNGNMTLIGTGSTVSTGDNNFGVDLKDAAGDRTTLTSTGSGGITVTGARGAGVNSNGGVLLDGALIQSNGGTGALLVQTAAGGTTTGTNNYGVFMFNNSDIDAGAGGSTLTISGTAGNGTATLPGFLAVGAAVSITSGNGNIVISGTGGTGGTTSVGATLQTGASVLASGNSSISITGTAGSGTGGFGFLSNGGIVDASGTGSITISGTASTNTSVGISLSGTTAIATASGAITITGAADEASSNALEIIGTSVVGDAGTSGTISLIADSLNIASGAAKPVQTTGTVVLRQQTNGTALDLGSAGGPTAGTLQISDAEQDQITAGSIKIGDSNSGSINISAAFSPANAASLLLQSGGSLSGAGLITSTNLGLISATGMSVSTAATNLAFRNTTSGSIVIGQTGAVTIANLSTLDGTLATSGGVSSGGGSLTAASPITFAVNAVTNSGAGNTFTYTSADNGAAGADNITVNTGVLVQETTGSVSLLSGDSIVLGGAGSTVQAAQGVTLTSRNADTDTDGNISLGLGTVIAGTTATLTGGNNAALITQTTGGAGSIQAVDLVLGQGRHDLRGTANDVNTVSTTGAGRHDVVLNDIDDLSITGITANAGQVAVVSAGALTVNGNISSTANTIALTGSILTVNPTFTITTGNSAITLTTTTGALNVGTTGNINAGATTGTILLTSAAGATGSALLTARDLGVIANGGVNLTTAVSNLAVQKTGNAALSISNTGALTIANLSALNVSLATTSITSANTSSITAASPVTFAVNTTSSVGAGNNMTYLATDSAGAGDDMTINAAVTVRETTGSLRLRAGDNFTSNAGSTIRAAENIEIRGDFGNADAAGSTLTLTTTSILSDSVTGAVTIQTAGDADTLTQTGGSIVANQLEIIGGNGANTFTFSSAANDVDIIATSFGGNSTLTYADVDGLDIGTAGGTSGITHANGTVTITATGALTISQNVALSNTASTLALTGATITQTAGSITAPGFASFVATQNNLGDVRVTDSDGSMIFRNDTPTLLSNGTVVGGDLIITATGGAITDAADADDSAGVGVAGLLTVSAGGSSVTLNDPNNSVSVVDGSGNVVIVRAGVIDLGSNVPASAVTNIVGDLSVTSTDSGFVFNGIQNGNAIVLNGAGNNFNNVAFQTDTVAGSGFVTNAETGITQSVPVTFATPATSAATFVTEASSGNTAGTVRSSILLGNAANVLAGNVTFNVQETNAASFGDVSLTHSGANDIIVNASTLRRNFTLTSSNAAADFTQTGAITGTTSSRFIADVAGAVNFGTSSNTFGFMGGTSAGEDVLVDGDFRFRNSGALTLTGSRALNSLGLVRLQLDTGGLTQGASHDLQALTLAVVTSGTGNVALTSTLNQVGTVAASVFNGKFSMVESDNLIIGSVDGVNGISVGANQNVAFNVGGALTATGSTTPITIGGTTGTLEIQADSIGASAAAPVYANGTYTLQAVALSGGLFMENQTNNATVTIGNVNVGGGFLNPVVAAGTGLNALGGDISFVETGTTSNLTVNSTVTAGIDLTLTATNNMIIAANTSAGATADLSAGNDLTTTATIDGTDITLTSGGALTYGAAVGTSGSTTTLVIDNTGLLTRTVNTATMSADTVTFQGNGATGTTANNSLRLNTLALILAKGGATAPIRISNINAGATDIEGIVGDDFSFNTLGTLQVTDNDLEFSGNNVLADIRTTGSITKQSANATIDFTGTGTREIVLVASGASTVGTTGTSVQGDSDPSNVVDALLVNNASRIAGSANGGFYVVNSSTNALEVGSVVSGAVFNGLTTISGLSGNNGVELYTEGGLNVTQDVTAQTNGYIALVGNFANGNVTIGANVRNNNTSGSGSVILEGTPVINVAPIAGVADVLISDRNPNGGILANTSLTGNVVLTANDDYIIGATITHTGATSTLTVEADANNDGNGGIIFISGNNGTSDVDGRITTNGNLTFLASELMNDYSAATILDPSSNPVIPTYTVHANSQNTLGLNTNGDATSGNGIVFASNVFAATTNPQISMTNAGTKTATFNIKAASDDASVVQLDQNRAITGTAATLIFTGNGNVGIDNLGNINPLRTRVAGMEFSKLGYELHLREFDGVTITSASDADLFVLEAGTDSNGTASTGSGAVNQAATAVLTIGELNIINRRGAVDFSTETNFVNEISLGSATGNFLYLGGTDLDLTGPVSSGNTTTLNVGTFDIDQTLATATITATSTVNLTFNNFDMRGAISAGSSGTVNIFNQGDMLNFNPTLATNRITANTLNITDQPGGGGSIGQDTTSTTLTNNVQNIVTDNYDGFIKTTVATVNISKTTLTGGSVNLLETDGIQLGSVNMDGDLFVATQATGAIIQNPANGVIIGGQAQFITADGAITLNSNVQNDINAFGRVIALNGHFRYLTTVAAPDNEVNFNGLIQTTSGTGLNPSDVQITFGSSNDAVFAADGDIFANDAVTITRFGGGTGQVRTSGNIRTSGDNILFTSADGVLNVQLEADVIHSTNGSSPNPFSAGDNANVAQGGNITYNATVDSAVGPFSLTDYAGTGDISFNYTVGAGGNNLNRLEANGSGTTTFSDDVTAVTVITDFNAAQRGGTTVINGGANAVVTTGFQIYNDNVRITDANAATTNLDATIAGGIEFNGTLNTQTGNNFVNLILNDAGDTRFNGNVGTTRSLQTLTSNSANIFINGVSTASSNFTPAAPDANGITIQTIGTQNYNATTGIFVGGGTTAPNVLRTDHGGAADTTEGDILFSVTLNGLVDGVTATAAGQNDLVLIAGKQAADDNSDIVFGNTVGVTTQMGDILIVTADNVTMAVSAGTVIGATTFIQAFGHGTTTVSGDIITTSDDTPDFFNSFVSFTNNVVQADTLAGGVQINTDQIIVNADITAQNNGIIRLNGLNAGSDVVIVGGTVQTTGVIPQATRDAIGISAGDDIIIGSTTQTVSSIVQTTDGSIRLTAVNGTPNDNANGIVIQAADINNTDAFVTANGAVNGDVFITTTANNGVLTVNGGDFNGAQARVQSADTMTVNADLVRLNAGQGNNAIAQLLAGTTQTMNVFNTANVAVALQLNGGAGPGTGARASMLASGDQTIIVSQGDIELNGGAATNNRADIETSEDDQVITITGTGDLLLTAGSGEEADARIRGTSNADTQIITINNGNVVLVAGSDATNSGDALIRVLNTAATQQTVDVTGTLTLTGGTGTTGLAAIRMDGLNQLVDVTGQIQLNGGSAGTNNDAQINMTNATGNQIVQSTAANIDLNGGAGTSSEAGIISSNTQTVTAQTGLTLDGGTGNASNARISADNTQVVTATTGNIALTGGNGANSNAFIRLTNTVVAADQTVNVLTGNLIVTANQDNGANNSDAFIEMLVPSTGSDQTINVVLGSITLTAGAGNTERAYVSSEGNQDIDALTGITVQGYQAAATGNNSTAFISQNLPGGIQTIDVNGTAANFTILGGRGTNGTASVTAAGLTQQITVDDGALTVQGNQNADGTANGSALIRATNTAAVQTILVVNGGILVQGGADANETASIEMTGANGQQRINLSTDGDLRVEGGNGANSGALITSAGLDSGPVVAQRITIDAGQLIVRGNQDNANNASTAIISQTNTGAASQVITVNGLSGTDGTVLIEGGDGTGEIAQILSNGTVVQTITIARGLTMQGGDGADSTALITSTGIGQAQSVTVTTGNALLTGGTADNTQARIEQTNAAGTQLIDILASSASSNLELLGGTGTNADAAITAAGTVQTINVNNGLLRVRADQTGAGTDSDALIRASNTASQQTITVGVGSGTGYMVVVGGNSLDDDAAVTAANLQTITIAGRFIGNPTVEGFTAGDVDYIYQGGFALGIKGGAGQNASGAITAGNTQLITATTGDVQMLGGDGQDASASIVETGLQNAAANQTVDVNDGKMLLLGGAGQDAFATVVLRNDNNNTGVQTIDVAFLFGLSSPDTLTLLGGSGQGAYASIENQGTGLQSVTTTRQISLVGGTGDGAYAAIHQSGTGNQQLTISGAGDLKLTGGDGEDSDAFILADGNGATPHTQDITVNNGNIILQGNTDNANNNSAAFIESTSSGTTQTINVLGAGQGNITMIGGTGDNEFVAITSGGIQTIGSSGTPITGVISMTGGNGGGNGSFAEIRAFRTQNIRVGNGLDAVAAISVLGGSSTGNNDYALIVGGTDGTSTQTITTSEGSILLTGNQGNSSAAVNGSSTEFGAGIVANGLAQTITINGVTGSNDLILTGGTINDSAAVIELTNTGATTVQNIDVNLGSLTANGGTGTDAYALIRSRGTGVAGVNIAQVIEVENAVTLNGNAATSSVALGQYLLGSGIVSAGSQTLRTVNSVAGGNVALTAGTVQDSRAVVSMDSATGNQLLLVRKGNLTLDGGASGAATGAEAIIDSNNTQEIGQSVDRVSGFVTLKGGSGNGANALITAVNTQGVFIAGGAKDTTTFTNAALGLIGGSNTTEGGDATISQTNGTGTQTINILSGNAEILGGSGLNADARISAAGVSQTITVTDGTLWVKADLADNTTANSDAVITATNTNAVQTLNVTNGGIIVQGGVGSTELATISMTGASGRQTINVLVDGDLLVEGGDGAGSVALITSAGINNGGNQAQRIIIDAGQLTVRGNQDATNGTGSATISQTNNAANTTQFIQVSGTTGNDGKITVLGGAGTSDSALISSVGRGTLGQQISASSDMTVQGGTGSSATAGITHAAAILGAAANGQTLTVGGNLLVQGGSGANASALIQSNRTQSITVTGNASILADTDGTNGGGSATINQTVFLNINQTIIVNGTTGLTITGGAAAGDSAGIDKVAITGGQTVTVANGSIVINGGSGLAVADNYGRIRSLSTGSQTINVANSGSITLNGNQGSSADAFFGGTLTNYGAAILSAGNQNIDTTTGGAITLNGGNDTGAAALIGASGGTQNITARGAINVNAGSANQTSAQIRSLVQQQTILANGDINVTGNGTVATDNFAIIRGGLGQSITTTAGGNLIITANNSSSSGAEGSTTGGLAAGLVTAGNQNLNIAGRIDVFAGAQDNAIIDQTSAALSAQTITAGGSINLTDGIGGDAVINAASTTVAGQQITATGSINLTANDGHLTRISSGNNQLITTAATLNMSGDITALSEARINAQTSRLNINGAAASTWNGAANYIATTQATINNNGAIVVNESTGFTGAVTTPTLIFVTGNGTIGGTVGGPEQANTRLNTDVTSIVFDGMGAKTINISEIDTTTANGVSIQGTVGTLNLITDVTGDITDGTATIAGVGPAFNATTVILQTADGNIDLGNQTNSVGNFRGLIANNGFISYNGAGATTFANRTTSAEILAGDGVFADSDITIITTGNSTFTTDVVRSTGGDIAMTANQIIFNATNGSTGGITGPTGGVGSVITQDGSQTYNSAVVLSTNTFMSASGNNDAIDFMSTINGPGGLEIGSTPSFNGNIGTSTPLAYLILNSPANSNFNAGGTTAVINGSFLNQGGGVLNINGNWVIFVDNGVAGPGPGTFAGGTVNVGGSLAIFAPTPGSVSGSGFDTTENFLAWNGGVNGQPIVFTTGISGIFYKAPPPADEIKDKKNRRKDVEADYTVSYEEGVNAGTMVTVSGLPLADAGQDKTRVGGLLTTSYGVNSPQAINSFYFGREVQAPIQLETDKLVIKGEPNRN